MEESSVDKRDIGIKIEADSILFFDMDGTLVNTDFANYLSYKMAIQSVIQTKISISYNQNERINRSSLKIFPNLTEAECQEIIQTKEENYKEYLSQTKLNKSVADILIKYHKRNKTVLVTNCREDRALMILNYHGLTNMFSNFFFRQLSTNNEKINKFQKAIQSLGVSPNMVIVFENEKIEIADAINTGIPIDNILILYTMSRFTIVTNEYLHENIQAFYNSEYSGGNGRWKVDGTIENIICTLKNDITPFREEVLDLATQRLSNILKNDLPKILEYTDLANLTVCVIPRAKVNYDSNQLLLKSTIQDVVNKLCGFSNGIDYIIRHTDTRTTHRDRAGYGGTGKLPYVGITRKTCTISNNVKDKDILLIDDLYTESVNIDEDAIQALIDKGARSVFFYAIGRAV